MDIVAPGTTINQGQSLSLSNRLTLDYTELAKKEWKPIIFCFIISLIISLLFIYLLSHIWKIKKCYLVALFLFVFFLILLIIGDKFIKNLATFVLSTSILAMILTIFAFIAADLANCRPDV